MRRRSCRAMLIFMAMLIAAPAFPAGPAAAQTAKAKKAPSKDAKKKKDGASAEARNWNIGRDPAGPLLFYGKSQTEDVSISFTCQTDVGLVRIIAYDIARGVKPGDGARVRLSNGPARLEVAAIALPNDKNPQHVDLGGTTKINPRVFRLLRGGDSVVLEVPGRTTGISLKTLAGKNDAFERACLGGKPAR